MFELKRRLKETIDMQSKLIQRKDGIIKKQLLNIQELKDEATELILKNSKYRQALREIKDQCNKQQYESIVNLENIIKEIIEKTIS